MNYYERHLGDYAKDAGHLTMLEHGAYTLLLDRYYTTESAIPADQVHRVARARTDDEKAAVDVVLAEFFTLENGAWKNARAEEEITKAKARIEAARTNGKRGGRPRSNPDETDGKPDGFPVGSPRKTQPKALHTPYTNSSDTDVSEGPGKPARFNPLELELPECVSADDWRDWVAYRRKRKLTTAEQTMRGQLVKLQQYHAKGYVPADVIRESITNGWQGLFEPKAAPSRRPAAMNNIGVDDEVPRGFSDGSN